MSELSGAHIANLQTNESKTINVKVTATVIAMSVPPAQPAGSFDPSPQAGRDESSAGAEKIARRKPLGTLLL